MPTTTKEEKEAKKPRRASSGSSKKSDLGFLRLSIPLPQSILDLIQVAVEKKTNLERRPVSRPEWINGAVRSKIQEEGDPKEKMDRPTVTFFLDPESISELEDIVEKGSRPGQPKSKRAFIQDAIIAKLIEELKLDEL